MEQIAGGQSLLKKSSAPASPPPAESRGNPLLAEIAKGASRLKHTEPVQKPQQPVIPGADATGVAGILARRIAIVGAHSESEESEEGDDDDWS